MEAVKPKEIIKVLIIDDEPDILETLDMLLSRHGHQVDVAADGSTGLKMLSEKTYDVVVCDYIMPRMNGVAVLKCVREKGDLTPFIFFSGNADNSHGIEMASLGAYELLPKTEVMRLPDILINTMKHNKEIKRMDENKTSESADFLKLLHSSR